MRVIANLTPLGPLRGERRAKTKFFNERSYFLALLPVEKTAPAQRKSFNHNYLTLLFVHHAGASDRKLLIWTGVVMFSSEMMINGDRPRQASPQHNDSTTDSESAAEIKLTCFSRSELGVNLLCCFRCWSSPFAPHLESEATRHPPTAVALSPPANGNISVSDHN